LDKRLRELRSQNPRLAQLIDLPDYKPPSFESSPQKKALVTSVWNELKKLLPNYEIWGEAFLSGIAPHGFEQEQEDARKEVLRILTSNIHLNVFELYRTCPGKWLTDSAIDFFVAFANARESKNPPEKPYDFYCNNIFFKLVQLVQSGHRNDTFASIVKTYVLESLRIPSIFGLRNLIVPVNINNSHWALMLVQFQEQKITCFDSLFANAGTPRGRLLLQVLCNCVM
jgi:hypothetical protein